MALAEARAAWQRTANRYLVQEDAKRAPKLACCSSLPPSAKPVDDDTTAPTTAQDIPYTDSQPFDRYSNLSPNSKWWLHLQPNYGYQKVLIDEQLNSQEGSTETCQMQESLDDSGPRSTSSSSDNQCGNFTTCHEKKDFGVKEEEGLFSYEVSKLANEVYFDSESSWIGAEKNTPWWRTADTEELAFIVAQRSLDVLENCDLPRPQNKKDLNVNNIHEDDFSISSLNFSKPGIEKQHHMSSHAYVPSSLTARSSCQKLRKTAEAGLVNGADRPIRDSPTNKRMPDMHAALDDDLSKAQLLEALRHSQTRAREAEKVAKQAYEEKEHVVKLVLRQATQIFAYKQWLHLLQLENMYFQLKTNNTESNLMWLPMKPQRSRKTRKSFQKSSSRKRAKRSRPWFDVGKYAVVFALGLGLVGAGLLLGWTIGWMLPIW